MRFSARVVTGSGRGKRIGSPTINMNLDDVPPSIKEGIYACWVKIDDQWQAGALHYGPRPVFKDTPSCEVYLLDMTIANPPETLDVELVSLLRPILDFPSVDELIQQIDTDIAQTRAMLKEHGPPAA